MLLYLAVLGGSFIAGRVPLRAAYALASVVGLVASIVARRQSSAIQSNLALVLDAPTDSRLVKQTARTAFQNNAKNWIDSLRLERTTRQEVIQRVQVEGWETFEDAVASGQGVIMIGAHLGNIDMVGQIMAAHGVRVVIPVEPIRPAALFERTQRLRRALGIEPVPAANSARRLLRALKEGDVVGIMADRKLEEDGIEVEFFGRKTVVSRGPAWLATHCSSPVLCGTGTRNADGTFAGLVTPLEVQRTNNPEADLRVNAQTIMAELQRRITRDPQQWCMFVPLWTS